MRNSVTLLKIVISVLSACLLLVPDTVLAAEVNTNIAKPSPVLQAGVVTSPPPARTLTLSECFDRADKYNKEIISNKWNLAIQKAGIRIADALPNPQFLLQEGFGETFVSLITGQSEMIAWTERIQTAGKRSKKIDLAKANYGLAELQLKALKLDVHNRVRRAYAELAAAEAYAELVEAQRAVGVKLLTIAEKRFEAGKAAQTEVLQAKLNVSQFDTQRNQAQVRLQQDSAALALIIGETPGRIEVIDVNDNGLFKLSVEKSEIVPSPSDALPVLERLLNTAYDSRPDLKLAQQQVYANRKALVLARAKRIPDLFTGGAYQYAHWSKHQPRELSPVPNFIGDGAYITVQMETPVFYQYQGEIRQSAANVRQSERQVELLKCWIATDVATAYNAVDVARANIFLFQKNLLPTASDVARIARRGYQVGATDLATAIVAQQQYQQTLSNYFDAVVAYQNAWADLEQAVFTGTTSVTPSFNGPGSNAPNAPIQIHHKG